MRHRKSVLLPALTALAALVVAATVLGGPRSATPAAAARPASATALSGSAPKKILVVIEENHSLAQMRSGMPFLLGEAQRYGYATDYTAITHPSEPNYLAIAGGSTFGVTDDKDPVAHYAAVGSAKSVFDQALAAGKTAHTYAESMPGNCRAHNFPERSVGTPRYAVRHNPWVYFRSGRSGCNTRDTSHASFRAAAAHNALPNVGFLIPNLCDDAHNCGLSSADTWLKRSLTPVLHSADFTTGKLVVVVTADEDNRLSGNKVLTAVLTPRLSHKVVTKHLTHYSLNRYIDQVLGVPALRHGATAPDLRAAFGL